MAHRERHRSERIGWLRAAVLGANDGIVSTASLVVGVAAASAVGAWLNAAVLYVVLAGRGHYRAPARLLLRIARQVAAEGVAADAAGNVYGAEVGPRQAVKYTRQ